MRILIAEDDYMVRQFLSTMLNHYGDVVASQSGRDALDVFSKELARRRCFDLICIETALPELCGNEVLKTIRRLEAEKKGVGWFNASKILMMTGQADRECVVTAIENGCDGFLLKPIEKEAFFRKLAEMGIRIVN